MNIFMGIMAILLVLIIWGLRESSNKWIALIGWGIILAVKAFH